jgi:predicted small lipoprotein YifL
MKKLLLALIAAMALAVAACGPGSSGPTFEPVQPTVGPVQPTMSPLETLPVTSPLTSPAASSY